MSEITIKSKEKDAIIQSLMAGVVPRIGLHHIQVGRKKEIEALLKNIEIIASGGSTIKFVIGEYGAGKTFFLNLIRTIALEKGLVTVNADLTPDRRLHATAGQARSLYAELMRSLSTRTKWDGGGLSGIVEKFISIALKEAKENGKNIEVVIHAKLEILSEMVNGYDFASVIASYWKGYDSGNEQLKSDAIRWLRAEFSTKTDAKNALGVRTIIDDLNFYDQLKLMSKFVRLAGYNGILIGLDEMVNLYKLTNTQARNANYEQILRIINDCLQGNGEGLGFIMCGTPEFLMDTRRGLYSYQALQSRLSENKFANDTGLIDYNGPILRLSKLTKEDLYVLLHHIRNVFALGDETKYLVPEEAFHHFMDYCFKKIGDAYFQTTRNVAKAFTDFLSLVEQNPQVSWKEILGNISIEKDNAPENKDIVDNEDEELAQFKL